MLKKDTLFICTDNAMFRSLLNNDDNKTQLRQALEAVAGKTYRLGLRSKRVVQKQAADPLSRLVEAGRQAGIP